MIIYVVTYCEWDETTIIELFLTEKLAEKYISQQCKKERKNYYIDSYEVVDNL